ncbi:hypothetical protein CTAYLR_000966 [Chrysophaeum taylorii]|uniref:glutamate--tRNA ligase n=1 Tax=Chrysophaeum taylorii TaxID=2483200 RepID=A0AAD7XMR6_9STRA|nr:hypothetical protein CTAYLR_000966 [Chrysophaeum taylorii]
MEATAAEMTALEAEISAQAEVVTRVKAGGEKEAIGVEVAKLVELKKKMTALDPSHPMALVDKASKKKKQPKPAKESEVKSDEISKNEAKRLAKKEKKKEKKAEHKAAAAAAPEEPAAPRVKAPECVSYTEDQEPLAARAVAFLGGDAVAFECVEGTGSQPTLSTPTGRLFGDAAIARFIARRAKPALLGGGGGGGDPWTAALVDQWVDFALSYPAVGDASTLAEAVDGRLGASTFLVGSELTLADIAVWAALRKSGGVRTGGGEHAERWFRLCESQPAMIEAKRPPLAKRVGPTSTTATPAEAAAKAPPVGGCPPLEGAEQGKVVTRFPPEPSGYLHIGHAKAVLLNDYYARRYEGKLIVRFDDTNPSKEKEEYAANIIKDLEVLGIDVSKVSHTSDYFEEIGGLARQLIAEGLAFMDDTPQESMQREREERKESKWRDAAAALNLERFEAMCGGAAPEWCLRAKIDMGSNNGTLRDPVLFRANLDPHHRTGVKYKAYPTYDMACPIVDSLEGVTHALRTTEYNDRDAQYAWLQKAMRLREVKIHAFSRVNFVRTLMSKRKLAWLVENKVVDGWNDPRFPTIQGVVRRGVSPRALRDFMVGLGASRNIINLEWDSFWATNKAAYEPTAPRYMAVEKETSVSLRISTNKNLPLFSRDGDEGGHHHYVTAPLVPKDPELGTRAVRVGSRVLLEEEDARSLVVGEEVVLMRWGVVKITKNKKEVEAEFVPDGVVKKKRSLHWLAATPDLVEAILVEYDYLIAKPKLEEDDQLTDPGVLTPVSKVETRALVDPALKNLQQGAVVQLERRGFYRVDIAYPQHLKLILIPDGKAKAPFSRLP